MKKILLLFLASMSLYSQDNKKLPSFYNMFIGREDNRYFTNYIEPDYIRDDYKRALPNPEDMEDMSYFEKYPFEMHMSSTFSYGIHNNTFFIKDLFFTLGQTFHNDYIAITPFATVFGYFDTHEPNIDYEYIKDNIGFYDGGFQAIIIDRILFSARGRAVFDINTTTFMLIPHYYEIGSPGSFDTPNYYIPQTLNGPGIRVGFIGNYYEIAYSQGDYRHSIPKAALFKLNLPFSEVRLLYQHENRAIPEIWTRTIKFDSLVQASSVFRFPLLNETIFINAIAEYTWRERDAHYIRIEQGFEWNILNIALREMIVVRDNKARFHLEYALFAKISIEQADFALGFQGDIDGRYYIAGNIVF